MDKKEVINNLAIAMIAQGISLVLSFLISFVVPKMLSVEAFSYWQLFIFYITYVGFFHFGLNDGVYLKYGGKDLKAMDKNLVSGQFKCLLLLQFVVIVVALPVLKFSSMETERKEVWVFVLIYMLIFNLSTYLSYIFQAANLTKWYSYSVILDKAFFMVVVLSLLLLRNEIFQIYIFFYVCGKVLCLVYCIIKGHELIFYRNTDRKAVIEEAKDSICVGIKLTLSAMASMLILGIGRFVIDLHWGIVVFGKISFALSLTTFILAFVQQVSMVFFPILRRIDGISQIKIYQLMSEFCFFVMPLVYFAMIPGKIFVKEWLPQYEESIYYLGILLPICNFDSKMNMIFNTFFKVLRKEKDLLKINTMSFVLSGIMSLIGVFLFNSYWFVLISMVISVMFRSIVSEKKLNDIFHIYSVKQSIFEMLFAAVYIAFSVMNLQVGITLGTFGCIYILSLFTFRERFWHFLREIRYILKF